MPHVMPDTGAVSTGGDAWPKSYHHMAKTIPAHSCSSILTWDVDVIFLAGTGLCNRMFKAPSGQFPKIDFGNSKAIWNRRVQSAPGSGRTTLA